jgi:hypothetical protein
VPIAALFVLFDAAVFYPTNTETRNNIIFLDIAAGHFSRLEYASGGWFRSSVLGEFAAMAKSYAREYERGVHPPMQPTTPPIPDAKRGDDGGRYGFPHQEVVPQLGQPAQLTGPGLPGESAAHVDMPMADDGWMFDPSLAGLDVMNLFGMEMPALSDDWGGEGYVLGP